MNILTSFEVLALALAAFFTGIATTLVFLSLGWLEVSK